MAHPDDRSRERGSAGPGGSQLGGNAGALNRGPISPAGTPPCDAGHTQSYGTVGSDSSRMAPGGPRCPVTVERARRHPAAMRYAAVQVRFRAAVSTPCPTAWVSVLSTLAPTRSSIGAPASIRGLRITKFQAGTSAYPSIDMCIAYWRRFSSALTQPAKPARRESLAPKRRLSGNPSPPNRI